MWAPRYLEDRLQQAARTRPVFVLTGARPTGHTSIEGRCGRGTVVCRTPTPFPLGDGVQAVSVATLAAAGGS